MPEGMSEGYAPGASGDGHNHVVGEHVVGGEGGGPLSVLRTLGTSWGPGPPAEALPARGKVNSHVHLPPNFSAFNTVVQAAELAGAQGVGVLAPATITTLGCTAVCRALVLARGFSSVRPGGGLPPGRSSPSRRPGQ